MPYTYADAIALVFGTRPFTVREFAQRTRSPRPGKTLSELKQRGYVERVGRARYRYLDADERPDLRAEEWRRVRLAVREAPFPKVWTGPSAVEVWTDYGYRVSPSMFHRLFHVAVRQRDIAGWRAYLRARRVSFSDRRSIGAHVVLVASARLPPSETVKGERVITRPTALQMVRSNRYLYAEADAWFRRRSRRKGAPRRRRP